MIGFVFGGVDVGEGLRELFIVCDGIFVVLLIIGGIFLYWFWLGSRDGGYCFWYCFWEF